MQERDKLITILNQILIEELNAMNQNIFHSKVTDNLDYSELSEELENETSEEIKQAEWLIKRIIFLEVRRTHQLSITETINNSKGCYQTRRNVG